MHIQLSHPPGTKCLNPRPIGKEGFVIFDLNMIHIVNLSFCSCGESGLSHPIQLLRSQLYPATVVSPRTAMTFRLLEAFELLSYESKISAWEYFKALARLTNNTKLETQKVWRTCIQMAHTDKIYLGVLSLIPPQHSTVAVSPAPQACWSWFRPWWHQHYFCWRMRASLSGMSAARKEHAT